MLIYTLFTIFFVGFFINLLWEGLHHRLYITCRNAPIKQKCVLLFIMSLKDGLWISFFYFITVIAYNFYDILSNVPQMTLFVILALAFSFFDEKISLKMKRWEYAPVMPTVFGVGISPLLEIAVTDVLTFWLVFYWL